MAIRQLRPIASTALVAFLLTGCSPSQPIQTQTPESGLRLPADESLLVVGDWGAGTVEQAQVAAAMSDYADENEVAAIFTTGDNFYFDDPDPLMEPFDWAGEAGIPFVVAWGNHDLDSPARVQAVESEFEHADRWALHEWGPLDIVILDSTQVDSNEQLAYFESVMDGSDDPTIVVFHHPPYSCGTHGGTAPIRNRWVEEFDDDVFLVLSGHEHNYQRFESEDVSYVVTGGGGRSLTPLADCPADHPERQSGMEAHHFVAMTLDDQLTVSSIDSRGTVIDMFETPLP